VKSGYFETLTWGHFLPIPALSSMGVCRGENQAFPALKIETKNQKFVENLKQARNQGGHLGHLTPRNFQNIA